MNEFQEPKYKIVGGKLVNRQSGKAIPDDEPVFILRARDQHAAQAIQAYALTVALRGCADHFTAVSKRLHQFKNWADLHRDRMKEPDTEMTGGWTECGSPPAAAIEGEQ